MFGTTDLGLRGFQGHVNARQCGGGQSVNWSYVEGRGVQRDLYFKYLKPMSWQEGLSNVHTLLGSTPSAVLFLVLSVWDNVSPIHSTYAWMSLRSARWELSGEERKGRLDCCVLLPIWINCCTSYIWMKTKVK